MSGGKRDGRTSPHAPWGATVDLTSNRGYEANKGRRLAGLTHPARSWFSAHRSQSLAESADVMGVIRTPVAQAAIVRCYEHGMQSRFAAAWIILGIVRGAHADAPKQAGPIDLDVIGEGSSRLAEAAGACGKQAVPLMRFWCIRKGAAAHDFVRRYRAVTAKQWSSNIVELTVPVEQYGKGFLFSVTEPDIFCGGAICLPVSATTAYVQTTAEVDVQQVADITLAFRVTDAWSVKQWWGPRLTAVTATLWDVHGQRVGEGTVLLRAQAR